MPTVSLTLALACAVAVGFSTRNFRRAIWQATPEDDSLKDNADRILFIKDALHGTGYALLAVVCAASAYFTLPAA